VVYFYAQIQEGGFSMLNLVDSFKMNFPGISEKALENLTRAAITMYANKHANSLLKREPGKYDPTTVRINRAYIAGLVNAYRECGWLVASEAVPGFPIANDDDSYVELIERIVEDWIRGDM